MKPSLEPMSFALVAALYCERQENTPTNLMATLCAQKTKYKCDGWMLLECHMLGSSWLGSLTMMPYGPNNTHKTPTDRPLSPRGLASDMSVCVGVVLADEIP